MASFSAQIDDWVKETDARMTAVFHKSAEKVGESVIRLSPIQTGFLRASFQASGSQMPVLRKDAKPDAGQTFTYDAGPINLVILGVPLGGTVFMGFTASYAGHVEYGARGRAGRGMVRLTAQKWNQIVSESIREAKAAVGRNRR